MARPFYHIVFEERGASHQLPTPKPRQDLNPSRSRSQGYFAKLQAELTGRNFGALLKKGKDTKLTAWVPSNGKPAMFVTLGSGAGIGVLGTCVFPSFMVAFIKSKDLFVGQTRKELGIKAV